MKNLKFLWSWLLSKKARITISKNVDGSVIYQDTIPLAACVPVVIYANVKSITGERDIEAIKELLVKNQASYYNNGTFTFKIEKV